MSKPVIDFLEGHRSIRRYEFTLIVEATIKERDRQRSRGNMANLQRAGFESD